MEGEAMQGEEVLSETKHTPGPWNIRIDLPDMDGDEIPQIVRIDPKIGGMDYGIAQMHFHGGGFGPQERADAHLIAAAPDLLAALEELVKEAKRLEWADNYWCISDEVDAARAAIAKAKGEPCA